MAETNLGSHDDLQGLFILNVAREAWDFGNDNDDLKFDIVASSHQNTVDKRLRDEVLNRPMVSSV